MELLDTVAVASNNPVKINAVKQAFAKMLWKVDVVGYNVPSGVNAQPVGREEIERGVGNRMEALIPLARGCYLVAIENGLIKKDDGTWYDVAIVAVCSPEGSLGKVNSEEVEVSESIVNEVHHRGLDKCTIGDVVAEWLNCDGKADRSDPHWKLTQGRPDMPPRHRQDILAAAVQDAYVPF